MLSNFYEYFGYDTCDSEDCFKSAKYWAKKKNVVCDVQRQTRFSQIGDDESWVHGYDIESKAQSYQWKFPEETRPKTACQVWWNMKILLTVFFDCNDVVHHEFLPQYHMINKEYNLEVIRLKLEEICQKCTELWMDAILDFTYNWSL